MSSSPPLFRCTNRLVESRDIFDTIINHRAFSEVAFILFLNKTDLLAKKVEGRTSDISLFFPEFQGDPFDLVQVQTFILRYFESTRRDQTKGIFHHYTTAIDTENIKVVFNAVRESIVQKNITQLMLQWFVVCMYSLLYGFLIVEGGLTFQIYIDLDCDCVNVWCF